MKLFDSKMYFLIFVLLLTNFVFSSERGVIKTIPSPDFPYGLTFDGTYLWVGTSYANTSGDFLWKIDTTNGSVAGTIPVPDPNGFYTVKALAFDGTYLWVFEDLPSSSHPDKFYKVNPANGAILKTINSPFNDYLGGMDFGNGSLWVSQYYSSSPASNNVIHQIDTTNGAILQTFSTLGEQPMGVAFDGQYVWCAEDTGFGATRQEIYQYDPNGGTYTGTFIKNPDNSPRDMAWDGQYLWLVGYNNRLLYQISTTGGTPNIQILTNTLNYGLVAIGDTTNQVLAIQNIGDADVTIDSINIDQSVFFINVPSFPIQIAPGGSYNLDVSFAPVVQGPVSGTMTIYNNDPLEPQIPISLQGQGQFVQPTIWLSATGHNFGSVWVPIEGKAKWVLNIANTGNENLEVVDLILNVPEFSVGGFSSYPIVIAPNDTFPLSVFFEPTAAQAYGDSLIIASTDPVNQYVRVGLIGTGVLENYSSGYVFWNYQVGDNPSAGSFQEYEVDGLKPINDINGDGRSEVVIATENYWLLCIDGNGSGITDTLWSFSSYISNSSAGSIGANSDYGVQDAIQIANDLNGDGYNDVVIATGGGNEHVYAIDGANGSIIWQYGTDDPNSYGLGDFEAVDVKRDFNGDGVEDVLAIADGNDTGTGYKKAFLFDGPTGNLIWDYPYPGPNLSFGKSIISIDDVNGDSNPDAIIAVGNNGSTDLKTYCLDGATGLPVWDREAINYEPKELLELTIPGETPDVIVAEYFQTIRRLDGETGIPVWTQPVGGSLAGIIQMNLISDINNDGIDDILIASFSAGASCLSGANGSYLWTYPMDYQYGISAVPDLDGDGIEEVVVGTGTSVTPFTGMFYCIAGQGDSLFFSRTINSDKVNTVNVMPSIDGNSSYELLAGTREGKVICYSGGLNAMTSTGSNSVTNITTYQLEQNYPNPFNPATTIKFALPVKEAVTFKIFNILGQEVTTLLKQQIFSAGEHEVSFNGSSLPSGIYIYRLESKSGVRTRKMMLMK